MLSPNLAFSLARALVDVCPSKTEHSFTTARYTGSNCPSFKSGAASIAMRTGSHPAVVCMVLRSSSCRACGHVKEYSQSVPIIIRGKRGALENSLRKQRLERLPPDALVSRKRLWLSASRARRLMCGTIAVQGPSANLTAFVFTGGPNLWKMSLSTVSSIREGYRSNSDVKYDCHLCIRR